MMTPEQYEQVERAFDAVVNLPRDQRAAYLNQHVRDSDMRHLVEAMLAADERSGISTGAATPLSEVAKALRRETQQIEATPDRIGRYRIIRCIGRGGMGIVYEAQQDAPRRRVALKMMRSSFFSRDAAKRFEVEAHVLGQLHHPGIAQIYESGVAEAESGAHGGTQPYFAMEFIDGLPLKQYVRNRQCSIRDRLMLLTQVAEAVHHAHQKGVIHRDLKPDNILVDEHGQPKVLDFGVARAIDSDMAVSTLQTDAGQLVGTLAYMSPEQVLGRPELIDTRSDVYALGVIAYEVLTDTLPLDLSTESIPSALRKIQEAEPPRIGHINARLRGDIETIVGKAMEKDKARRYQSAAELAADIRRYLHDEPIVARPASAAYLLRKFARRNTMLVYGAATVMLVLVAATIVSTMLYLQSDRNLTRALNAEQDAVRESAVAIEASGFLASMFEQANPWEARGRTISPRELVDKGVDRIERELSPDSPVRARLMHVIGNVYYGLGALDQSRRLVNESYSFHQNHHEPWHPLVMQGRRYLARLELRAGAPSNLETARSLLQESLGYLESGVVADAVEHGEVLHLLSVVASSSGDDQRALELCEQSLTVLAGIEDEALRRERSAGVHHMLGVANYQLGRQEQAEQAYRTALETFLAIEGREHPAVATGYSALGLTLQRLGRLDEAEAMLREAIAVGEIVWGAGSLNLTPAMNNFAITLESLGRLDEAERMFRQLIDAYSKELGAQHHVTLQARNNLAAVLTSAGKWQEAEELFTRTRAAQIDTLGADHPETLRGGNQLARLYERMQRWPEAERLLRDQHARYVAQSGEAHARTLATLASLAECAQAQGHVDEAIRIRQQELALRRAHFHVDDPRTLDALNALVQLFTETGRMSEAQREIDAQHALLREAGLTDAAANLEGPAAPASPVPDAENSPQIRPG